MVNLTYDKGDPIFNSERDWAVIPRDIDGEVSLSGSVPGGAYLDDSWFYHPDTNVLTHTLTQMSSVITTAPILCCEFRSNEPAGRKVPLRLDGPNL